MFWPHVLVVLSQTFQDHFHDALSVQWSLHYGAHCHWRDKVFVDFNVTTIERVLNVEPSIDHEEFYHATIPVYFQKNPTMSWLEKQWSALPDEMKTDALTMIREAAFIFAANAMCHPQDRVGKFDWDDVLKLHQMLDSPYRMLLMQHFDLQIKEL